MPSPRPILHALGPLLCGIAAAMLVPALADAWVGNPDWVSFAVSSAITAFFGGLCWMGAHTAAGFELSLRQAFIFTCAAWLVVSGFSALPFWAFGLSWTDAVFESISGITTTGSTVLTGIDHLPPGILLWRSVLQWIGGVGIIVMAIVMLPFLRVGGMQLFRLESSDRSDNVVTGSGNLVRWIAGIYVGFTALCFATYAALGMTGFDALNHAMTTLSTGGFSTHDASFAHFGSPALEWTAVFFMAAGALPFVAYIQLLRGGQQRLWHDPQVRGFFKFITLVVLALAGWRVVTQGVPAGEALTEAAFNVVSVVTTTGFASTDYTLWGAFVVAVFLLLTVVGGCAGSTSGAIKIYRFQIAWMTVRRQLVRLSSPLEVTPMRYGGRRVGEDVAAAAFAFIAVFAVVIAIGTVGLAFLGLDLVTALSASATAVTNVGPGLGPIVGPAGNFQPLPDAAKWLLSFAMIFGRLEIFPFLVLLDPHFWRG